MIPADRAEVTWEAEKKNWLVRIQVGEEVIRRHVGHGPAKDADEEAIRQVALKTAEDEGYALAADRVTIRR